MSRFQRIKSIVIGLLMLFLSYFILSGSENDYDIIALIIALSMIIFGLRLLVFYCSMSRHMIGGKIILYEAIIILDLGIFTVSMATAVSESESYIILFYLLNIYAFAGVIGILRAFEAKNNGLQTWKRKLFRGIFMVVYSIALAVLTIVFKDKMILKYGYCISLAYAACVRIVEAFRKTAIVYIS